jgi:hypothetical protein
MQPHSGRQWAVQSPYERFFDFIAPNADRFGVLREHTQKLGLNSVVITIKEHRHFFIFPKEISLNRFSGGTFPFRGQSPVVLTAHYDRVAGSPGANDNSAAVFQLLKAAIRLNGRIDRWIIIFTDKEELAAGEGIGEQGSFSLAQKLRSWGLSGARIFNFDACGTGDTFVFSSTTDYLLKKSQKPGFRRAGQAVSYLRDTALETARRLRISKVLSVPTPFSDDAGFLKGGIPAQTITMLPAAEAAPYASLLRNRPEFADLAIAGSVQNPSDRRLIPETWRCLNSSSDRYQRLTPEHYDKVVRFAVELCK